MESLAVVAVLTATIVGIVRDELTTLHAIPDECKQSGKEGGPKQYRIGAEDDG